MASIRYFTLGGTKKVNEIVMAGSHDAAITSGGIRTRTQNESIYKQAKHGVRIFDIRVSGQRSGHGTAKLSAFHGQNTPVEKTKLVGGVQKKIQVTKMVVGEWGLDLTQILDDAKKFVQQYPDEFIILKFDKSSNYTMIADACASKLDGSIYKLTGNLADKSLNDMRGKVVCAYMPDGIAELKAAGYGITDGVAEIVNVSKSAMPGNVDGLCYYGSGGTSVVQPKKYAFTHPVDGKFRQNIDKQKKLLEGAIEKGFSRDVLRMMYWTQTGMVRSIKGRDKKAWTSGNRQRLKELWAQGAYDYMADNIPRAFGLESHSTNFLLYRPNFIMIDFANIEKCQVIFDFNHLSTSDIVALNKSIRMDNES